MNKDVLKSALFGYSKISVCQYIATMNEEFNAKLMAETNSFHEQHSRQQKKIDALEADLAVHKKNECDVATMLLEARKYAEQVRQQAQTESEEALRQAKEEAEQLRQQAQTESEEALRQAKEEAEQLRQQTRTESEEALRQAKEEAEQVRQQARAESEEALRQAKEEAEQLRIRTKRETDQFLLEIKTKGQAQTKKLELYTGAIAKLREEMAMLANRTDNALNTFSEHFLGVKRDFEDSEV